MTSIDPSSGTARPQPRPGGRSARVQAAVHAAVRDLLAVHGRAALTVPVIAARAGVTPSTIYRRWGDLGDLLADVAVERLRPDAAPADTGSLAGDLLAWAEQYRDEMSSEIGLGMLRDVVAVGGGVTVDSARPVPCRCAEFTSAQIAVILDRADARGETAPAVESLMDAVVAPIVYRTLFGPAPATAAQVAAQVAGCLKAARPARRRAAA